MPAYMPEMDTAACSAWNEQDREMYAAMPYYFVKLTLEYRKNWTVWAPLFGKIPWQANMGPIMRGIRTDPSPNIRQTAYPNSICAMPKVDVIVQNEVTVDAGVARQQFKSKVIDFCSDFRSFVTDHIDMLMKDMNEKIVRFEDVYARTQVLEGSPNIWVADQAAADGPNLTPVPAGATTPGVQVKTAAMLAALAAKIGNPGNLSLMTIDFVQTVAESDLRIPPFSGSTKPVDNAGLDDKWVLILSSEAWNQFKYDPWLLANKSIDLNIVTEKFKGSLWGKIVCRLEDFPLRMLADGTFPAPQTIEMNPAAYNHGETISNSVYNNAPYEFAWMVGAEAYKTIQVGPPPKHFAGTGMPAGFGKMQWNGEVFLTKNISVPCLADDGETIIQQPNVFGDKLQAVAQATYGAIGVQRRNIIPILFKRRRGGQ